MNKIEFEDLLSKYIENDLSLVDRKKIEAYLNDNKEARTLLSSTKKTLRLNDSSSSLVSAVKDSSKAKKPNRKKFDLKDKVQFVKDGD